ncbi:hypothetical protein SLS56_008105 [Neofusicoccum ribis]|uniref:Trichothecene 3-O-acetyltransferase-like N-terminal domain-containing protein n=1 Tax=Neofusicoccum ribis TaxID=45134 RepID=A0ABR3SL28_9PEZI
MVEKRPFLAGRLKRHQQGDEQQQRDDARPGSLSLEIPSSPIDEVKLDVSNLPWECSYEELRAAGMPLSKLDGSALSPVPYGVASSSNRVFEAKLSFIPGGCFLSVSTCHAFVDAWGFIVIMDMWSRCCREIQAAPPPARPAGSKPEPAARSDDDGSRPPALFGRKPTADEYESLRRRPELWQLLGLDWRHRDRDDEQGPPAPAPFQHPAAVKTCMFSVSPAGLAAIKKMATPNPAAPGGEPQWISTKDALVAFLWRSIIRARAPSWTDDDRRGQSMVSVAIDGRRALSPAIPLSYIGNVVFCCLTWLPVEQLVARDDAGGGLAAAALAIRRSIAGRARDPRLLADAVRLAAGLPDVGEGAALGNAFTSWFARDLVTTSVVDLPIYDLDFGGAFGGQAARPEFFRMPRGQFDGICMVQPKQRDGVVDVILSLEPDQMARLMADGEFREHMAFLSE